VELEANRSAIVEEQWRLSNAAIEAHRSHDEANAPYRSGLFPGISPADGLSARTHARVAPREVLPRTWSENGVGGLHGERLERDAVAELFELAGESADEVV
jgi:hypothetical protein